MGVVSVLTLAAMLAPAPIGGIEADRARITRHLEHVETELRARPSDHLSAEQRAERARNLDRLHEYRIAGEFPHNDDFPHQRVPYFIDDDGRACAVGHLMIESGGGALAARVRAQENNAFLLDMRTPGLTEWVERSGLTAQESAMIQPSYCDCPQDDAPVCGTDGNSYLNECYATVCGGVMVAHEGLCAGEPTTGWPEAGTSTGMGEGASESAGESTATGATGESNDDGDDRRSKGCRIGDPGLGDAWLALVAVGWAARGRRRSRPPSRRSAAAVATVLVACGPGTGPGEDTAQEPTTGTTDASTGTTSETEGIPVCEGPSTAAAFDWQRGPGNDGMPGAGERALVASDGAGNMIAAMVDLDEPDADVRISQYEPGGALRWSLRYEGMAGFRDEPLDLAVAPDGSIHVVVHEQLRYLVGDNFPLEEWTVTVLAIEADGTPRWRYGREVPPPYNARAAAIAVTSSDHVIVLDADVYAPETTSRLELDRWGNELARVDMATPLDDQLFEIDVAPTSGADLVLVTSAYRGFRIARIAGDGTVAWEDRADGALATSLAIGPSDEAYLLLATGDAEAGDAGFALRRYEPDGALAWEHAMEWPTGDGYPAQVVVDCTGTAIVAGEVSDYPERTPWLGGVTPTGEPAWSTMLSDPRALAPRAAALAPDGALLLGGLQGSDLNPWVARLTGT